MKKIHVKFFLFISALVMMLVNNIPSADAAIQTIERGDKVFKSTWIVNYPNDDNNRWKSTITDNDFLGLGSYTITEKFVSNSKGAYVVRLQLNDKPVSYEVEIREGNRGYGMDVMIGGKGLRTVLAGWRDIRDNY